MPWATLNQMICCVFSWGPACCFVCFLRWKCVFAVASSLFGERGTDRGDCNLLAPQSLQWMDGMFGAIKFLLCREREKERKRERRRSNLAAVSIPHRWLYWSAGMMWRGCVFTTRWRRAREFIRDVEKRVETGRGCPWGSRREGEENCSRSISY